MSPALQVLLLLCLAKILPQVLDRSSYGVLFALSMALVRFFFAQAQ